MDGRNRWCREEVAIGVYFISRLCRADTVKELLLRRGYSRSVGAITRKMREINQVWPKLKPSRDWWDLEEVDSWLDNIMGDHKSVNTIIHFTLEDAEYLEKVRQF